MKKLNKDFVKYLEKLNKSKLKDILDICTDEERDMINHALSIRVLTEDEIFEIFKVDDKTIMKKTANMLIANKFKYDSKHNYFVLTKGTNEYKFNLSKFKGSSSYSFSADLEEYVGIKYYYASENLEKIIKMDLPNGKKFTPEEYANFIDIEYTGKSMLTMVELTNPNSIKFEIAFSNNMLINNDQEERIQVSNVYSYDKYKTSALNSIIYNSINNTFEVEIDSFYADDYQTALNVIVKCLKEEYIKETFHFVKEVKGVDATSLKTFTGSLYELYKQKLDNRLIVKKYSLFDLISFLNQTNGNLPFYTTQKFYKKEEFLDLVDATVIEITK